jgi:hypothetical protein
MPPPDGTQTPRRILNRVPADDAVLTRTGIGHCFQVAVAAYDALGRAARQLG